MFYAHHSMVTSAPTEDIDFCFMKALWCQAWLLFDLLSGWFHIRDITRNHNITLWRNPLFPVRHLTIPQELLIVTRLASWAMKCCKPEGEPPTVPVPAAVLVTVQLYSALEELEQEFLELDHLSACTSHMPCNLPKTPATVAEYRVANPCPPNWTP